MMPPDRHDDPEEEAMAEPNAEVLGTFYGDDAFPIDWASGERELFWVYDDLHIPNPVSPMFFDLGGWWLSCDHMFRRFGTPFACDWIAKTINGYVYTAAIPARPGIHAEATEYGNRYVPRVPRDEGYAEGVAPYLPTVLPVYAQNFMDWWRERLRPEIERNFAYLDAQTARADELTLAELAVLLEDALDAADRHWKIHWMINFAQFSATLALKQTIAEVKGDVDPDLQGRLQSSVEDRNWDSIEALWRMKAEVLSDDQLGAAFTGDGAAEILRALQGSERGRRFVEERLIPYQREFGYKSIWSHEFAYPLWRENPAPILEQIRGYVATDYDYPSTIQAVRDDLDAAVRELMEDVPPGEDRERLQRALEGSLRLNPLTPDHHFYVDQGTNARTRLVLVAIGRKLVERGDLWDAEDVMYLRYQELRQLIADPAVFDARERVGRRRDEREAAAQIRPRAWVGTATQEALEFPYLDHWGFPARFHRGEQQPTGELRGLAASPGVVEGPARLVGSLAEFDAVRAGEVLVCQMTNPAWVVLFTKICGLVTDAGGTGSHPAVVSREFGIPAVVGTSTATQTISTGDRVRVNGSAGVVEILS
jgi:phosphohistidine swiveling domain-containing protein